MKRKSYERRDNSEIAGADIQGVKHVPAQLIMLQIEKKEKTKPAKLSKNNADLENINILTFLKIPKLKKKRLVLSSSRHSILNKIP